MTWTWANSGRWWGKPGMLQSMGSQRVRHNLTTEQQQQISPKYQNSWDFLYAVLFFLLLHSNCYILLYYTLLMYWVYCLLYTPWNIGQRFMFYKNSEKELDTEYSSVQFQFSSITQSCLILCDPMDCSIPGFLVLHWISEFAQIHVHWVSDYIQPSHPLLPPSPSALNLSQHQGFFWIGSSHQVVKILELQLQHQSFQLIFRVDFL